MRVFVINLDKNTDRMDKMRRQLTDLCVEHERFPAVYGAELSHEEKKSAVNDFAWWCTQGYPARDGQVGCALSHANIYRKMLSDNIGCACILEDDVVFDARFKDVLDFVEKRITVDKPEVVLLHCHFSGESQHTQEIELRRIKYERCAESYILTRKAAELLIEANVPIRRPCDHWFKFAASYGIHLYQAFPTTCRQDWSGTYASDIYTGNCVDVRTFGVVHKCLWKMKRCVGKTLEFLLRY